MFCRRWETPCHKDKSRRWWGGRKVERGREEQVPMHRELPAMPHASAYGHRIEG